jgi:hypothetical protein
VDVVYLRIQKNQMAAEIDKCVFCGMTTLCRGHHIVPKSKGGTKIVPTCVPCESFIHGTWTHQQLRDVYNTVDSILWTEQFRKFLAWRKKQPPETIFTSDKSKTRSKRKYS